MEAGGLIRFGPGTNVSSAILVDDPSGDEAGVVDENAVDVEDLDDDDEDEDDIKLTTIKLVAKRKRVDTGSQHDTRRRKGEHKQGGLSQAGSAKGPADFKHKSTAQKQIKKGDAKMLAIPLPSRRFNKDSTRRATLFPVEQLPVFALPPLPEIKDEAALKQVFTHLSLFQKVKYKFEDPEDDLPKHYEKIEHVGDSLLGMIVTTWLHEIKPGLTPGTATVSLQMCGKR
jgi:ribonuclease-3